MFEKEILQIPTNIELNNYAQYLCKNFIMFGKLCTKESFDKAMKTIIDNQEILNRFGDNAKDKLFNFQNTVDDAFDNVKNIESTLKRLNSEIANTGSYIRSFRVLGKMDYVKEMQQGIVDYDKEILKAIRNHTPNGLECCACQYIAP